MASWKRLLGGTGGDGGMLRFRFRFPCSLCGVLLGGRDMEVVTYLGSQVLTGCGWLGLWEEGGKQVLEVRYGSH